MRTLKIIPLLLLYPGWLMAQLHVQRNAIFWIGQNSLVAVGGDVSNEGSLENAGTIAFTGNWTNTNTYIDDGTLEAIGTVDQTISNLDQDIATLIVNGSNIILQGNTVRITNELNLTNGIVKLGSNTALIIEATASITGGSSTSYIDGKVIQIGTGSKFYPIGIDDRYMPLELLNVLGSNVEMAVSLGLFNGVVPTPDGSVIGVSDYHYWQLEVLSGSFLGSPVKGTFENANLDENSFQVINDFNFQNTTPGIVQSSTLEGPYTDLDIESVTDTDFLTFGTIVTSDTVNQEFIAVGLQAEVPEEGVAYVPTAFSPVAIDPIDRFLRVFTDGIVPEDFIFSVFNTFGAEVYRADYAKATGFGWDGINENTGKEEPIGSYRYFIRYKNTDGLIRKASGTFLLIK